tara:strand:- start:1060 stop:1269 length:210 start_codon:yes stop_codon:yes gene_type:complete
MSKVKEWLYDQVEDKIEEIKLAYKDEIINRDEAIQSLIEVEHADVWAGDDIDYSIASEILDDGMEGAYA